MAPRWQPRPKALPPPGHSTPRRPAHGPASVAGRLLAGVRRCFSLFDLGKRLSPRFVSTLYWLGIAGILADAATNLWELGVYHRFSRADLLRWSDPVLLNGIEVLAQLVVALIFWRVVFEVWILLRALAAQIGIIERRGRPTLPVPFRPAESDDVDAP